LNRRPKIKNSTETTILELTKSQLKIYRSLKMKKYRQQTGLFIAEGPHLIESLKQSDWHVERYVIRSADIDLARELKIPPSRLAKVPSAEFNRLTESKSPAGILAVVRMKDRKSSFQQLINRSKNAVTLLNLSDPGNLGTVIRTAAAFNYDLLVCAGNTVDIYNPKVVRATQGALFQIPVINLESSEEFLSRFSARFNIVAFTQKARQKLPLNLKINRPVLVFGGETAGIDPVIEGSADYKFRIDQSGSVESLNVAVAAGIGMYGFFRTNSASR